MRVEHLHTELADGKLLEGLLANGRSPLQPPSESPCCHSYASMSRMSSETSPARRQVNAKRGRANTLRTQPEALRQTSLLRPAVFPQSVSFREGYIRGPTLDRRDLETLQRGWSGYFLG
jgi:hypothetical protein